MAAGTGARRARLVGFGLASALACAAQAPAASKPELAAEPAAEPAAPATSAPSVAPPRDPEPPADAAADPFAPCPADEPTPPLSLIDLDYDAPYHLLVERAGEGGEWVAAERLPMPRHHASRIDWRNLADHPELAAASGRLRFTLRVESRSIERVAERRWNASYSAVIVAVCRP
ncbi:MAG: hypothetical protein R3A79_21395 [Nannocystaceae bacterium]